MSELSEQLDKILNEAKRQNNDWGTDMLRLLSHSLTDHEGSFTEMDYEFSTCPRCGQKHGGAIHAVAQECLAVASVEYDTERRDAPTVKRITFREPIPPLQYLTISNVSKADFERGLADMNKVRAGMASRFADELQTLLDKDVVQFAELRDAALPGYKPNRDPDGDNELAEFLRMHGVAIIRLLRALTQSRNPVSDLMDESKP